MLLEVASVTDVQQKSNALWLVIIHHRFQVISQNKSSSVRSGEWHNKRCNIKYWLDKITAKFLMLTIKLTTKSTCAMASMAVLSLACFQNGRLT
jgi:hypothetical protein